MQSILFDLQYIWNSSSLKQYEIVGVPTHFLYEIGLLKLNGKKDACRPMCSPELQFVNKMMKLKLSILSAGQRILLYPKLIIQTSYPLLRGIAKKSVEQTWFLLPKDDLYIFYILQWSPL